MCIDCLKKGSAQDRVHKKTIRLMVELSGLGPFGLYAQSIGTLRPSRRAGVSPGRGAPDTLRTPEVAPGISWLLDP